MTAPSRRIFLTGLAGLAAAGPAFAQSAYPSRSLTLVVPFAAGGSTDILARIVAGHLQQSLGQPVVIENRTGASGNLGTASVARAAPDGYTFLFNTMSVHTMNHALFASMPFDGVKDFSPIAMLAYVTNTMVVHPSMPAKTVREFIDYAKANPGKISYASAGAGSTGMIDCQLLNAAIGVHVTHVPYRGGGPAMQDIIGGRVDYICTLTGSVVPLVEGKTVKAIAVLTKERAPMLPNVKSSWEQGFKDLEASTWFSFMAPKGTPEPVIKKLHDATVTAMEDPEVQKQMLNSGAIVVPPEKRSTEYLRDYMAKEIEKNAAPIRAAGLSIE